MLQKLDVFYAQSNKSIKCKLNLKFVCTTFYFDLQLWHDNHVSLPSNIMMYYNNFLFTYGVS